MIRFCFICFLFVPILFHEKSIAQTWKQLEDYPGLERDDAVAFSIADCGFIVTGNHGGFSESNQMWKYNTTTNQWFKVADFTGEKRQYALAFTYNEFAYILGGISENNIPLNDFYRYNSFDDSWEQLESFPGEARWSAASAVHEKSAYVFGGTTLTNTLNDSWRFDFQTESWESLPPVPAIGKRDQVCFSLGDKIYLSSGFSINPVIFHSESYSFNTITHTWNTELEFPSEPIGYGVAANSATNAVVLGGLRADGTYSNEAWRFDGKIWTALPSCFPIGIKGMSSFSINNKFYFLTGKKQDLLLTKDFYVLSFENENDLLVYPNPSAENVHFYAPIGSKMEIYNSMGESEAEYAFNFSNEMFYEFTESGIYLVKIFYPNQEVQTKKVVIF